MPELTRDEQVDLMVRERKLDRWVAEALIDAGLPMNLGGVGFSMREAQVLDAAKERRHARAAREKARGEVGQASASAEDTPAPAKPSAPRAQYPELVRQAARMTRELLDGKGAPGPKQLQLTGRAIRELGNTPALMLIIRQQRDELLKFALSRRPAEDLLSPDLIKLMDQIAALCDGDPFCKGRRLAAQLVALYDLYQQSTD